jgi:hypothetical protein
MWPAGRRSRGARREVPGLGVWTLRAESALGAPAVDGRCVRLRRVLLAWALASRVRLMRVRCGFCPSCRRPMAGVYMVGCVHSEWPMMATFSFGFMWLTNLWRDLPHRWGVKP